METNVGEGLRRLIWLANMVPGAHELPDPLRGLNVGHAKPEHWQAFAKMVNGFPEQEFPYFRKYLAVLWREHPPITAYARYLEIREARDALRLIARSHGVDVATREGTNQTKPESSPSKPQPVSVQTLAYIRRDENGKVKIEHGRTLRALDGVEFDRIRECPHCYRLFWAERLDKRTCSSNCRQRVWCSKNPERWKDIQVQHESRRAAKEAAKGSRN